MPNVPGHSGVTEPLIPVFDMIRYPAIVNADAADVSHLELRMLLRSSGKAAPGIAVDGQLLRPTRLPVVTPLAAVVGPRLDLDAVYRMMGPERKALVDVIREDSYGRLILARMVESVNPRPQATSRHFSDEDIEKLIRPGVLVPTIESVGYSLPAFKVAKSNGVTSRFVTNAKFVNAFMTEKFPSSLPHTHDVVQFLGKHECYFQADASSFFYQIPVCEIFGDLLRVRLAAKRGEFWDLVHRALAMGLKPAPAIAQAIALTLAEYAAESTEVEFAVWIDNFIFGGEREVLARVRKKFVELCAEVNLILGECTDIFTQGEALGFAFGHGVVTPSTDTIDVLRRLTHTQVETPRQWFQLLGVCIWVCWSVDRTPLAHHQEVMSETRRIATDVAQDRKWDSKISIDRNALQKLREWSVTCQKAKCPYLSQIDNGIALITDASDWGAGATLWDQDTLLATSARQFLPEEAKTPIFVRELLAAIEGINWAKAKAFSPFALFVDNTIVASALTKGHSSSAIINRLIADHKPHVPRIGWVPSACNPADGPSRGTVASARCAHHHVTRPTAWCRH